MSNSANPSAPSKIALIGLSGSGKSVVAQALGELLGWTVVDSDELIEAESGKSVPRIFSEDGEERFRTLERTMTGRLTAMDQVVISTGGGAPVSPDNRRSLWCDTFVVWLEARPETLLGRVTTLEGSAASRPLLAGGPPLDRLRALGLERAAIYGLADWRIATDDLSPQEVADEIVGAHSRFGGRLVHRVNRMAPHESVFSAPTDPEIAARVQTPTGDYPVLVGWGSLSRLGERLRSLGIAGRVHVITDANVGPIHAEAALASLAGADYEARLLEIAPGEDNKTLAAAEVVFEWLISARAERREAIVALGGGVVTDLAGFVAATFLRGVPLIHVPTSLLGAVDASIGGKVAVDHRLGKNLVGAFYQPRLVLIDGELLRTLPERELTSGWAEVIKHGLITDPALVAQLEDNAVAVQALEPEALLPVLRRSVEIKAAVVSADERESGLRSTLNYGHTIGHALEAATSYRGPLHGEAVAVGMAGAGEIGRRLGLLNTEELRRQNRLLEAYGLPLAWPGADSQAVLESMTLDKKTTGAVIHWVMLHGIGRTVSRSNVPAAMVRQIVEKLVDQSPTSQRPSRNAV